MKNTKPIKKISIIGDGGWGTTLGIHLAKKKYQIALWGPFPEYLATIRKTRINEKFLPGIKLPSNIKMVDSLKTAIEESDMVVFAIPSKFAASVLKQISQEKVSFKNKIFVNVTKGFDFDRLCTMSQLIRAELGNINLAVVSGPTIASEVAKGIPSTAVSASVNAKTAQIVQKVFHSDVFRIYTNTDVLGVEIGGSVKNVIAIACGIIDGIGYGSNTKAAIITRGLVEIARLGKAMGAKAETFSGLSGLGDLITTCVSPKSRNRTVGEALGKGSNLKKILSSMDMVAEGVETVRGAKKLSQKYRIDMPITNAVYDVLYHGHKPQQVVNDLMRRKSTSE